MRRRTLSFRNKLLIFGIALTGVPLLLLSTTLWWQNQQLRETALSGSRRTAETDLDLKVDSIYRLCEDTRAGLERYARENLHAARVLMEQAGGVQSIGPPVVSWEARNQFTKAVSRVTLPQMQVGGEWLGQVIDLQTFVPVVDSVRQVTNATSTIFQRMNSAGDMLRVATNVIGDDGKRGVGTYVPAVGADGQPNAMVSTVLRGETFVGRAFVLNGWYMAAYEPLLNSDKSVMGMLYVGVPEASATEVLRRTLIDTKVGTTGYVIVLNATGATRGHYVVSRGGKRDGEDIWNSKDSNGNLFIQEMCRRATALSPTGRASQRYPWKNPDEPGSQMRVSRIKYFAPWDWVIGASIPEEEMYETSAAIDRISSRGETILWVICLATLAVSCAIWYFLANGWTRRTGRIIRELNEASSEMSSAAAQVAATSQRLAEDANQQAASNDKVTSSLNQMGSVAQHNLDHSLALKQLATEARGAAEGGALQILAMKETMSQIQSAGGDVVKINKIIDEIAFQTNILALNAAVEAARAGAVGLGFAVVADEVRGLAHRCTEAARETSEKIEKSMNAGRRGAVVTSEVTNKLEVITANTQKLDKLAQSVALASEQQRKGIGEINAAAKQMNRGYNPRRPTPRKGPAGPMNSARRRAQSGVSPGSSVRCSGQTREFDRPLNPPLTEAVRCGKPGCPPWRGDRWPDR